MRSFNIHTVINLRGEKPNGSTTLSHAESSRLGIDHVFMAFESRGAPHRERILRRRSIPPALWAQTLADHPFLSWREVSDVLRLRELATLFLATKEFTGARGFELDDTKAVAIAAQACLPVLNIGLEAYDGFKGIVVHADAVVAPREIMDDDGVVHQYEEELAGEAMPGGPVMLAWSDVRAGSEHAQDGYNVVIHEFAHVLDMQGGAARRVPPLASPQARQNWDRTLSEEYRLFCAQLQLGVDGVLDPYAAQSSEEFFAVAAEAYFVSPRALSAQRARLYALLRTLFMQDPATHEPG